MTLIRVIPKWFIIALGTCQAHQHSLCRAAYNYCQYGTVRAYILFTFPREGVILANDL